MPLRPAPAIRIGSFSKDVFPFILRGFAIIENYTPSKGRKWLRGFPEAQIEAVELVQLRRETISAQDPLPSGRAHFRP